MVGEVSLTSQFPFTSSSDCSQVGKLEGHIYKISQLMVLGDIMLSLDEGRTIKVLPFLASFSSPRLSNHSHHHIDLIYLNIHSHLNPDLGVQEANRGR